MSYHKEPVASVTAGASSCRNTSGLLLILVVLVETVEVKLVVLVAFCVISVSAVFKSFVNVVILLAL